MQEAVIILINMNKNNLQKVSSEIESQDNKALTWICNVSVKTQVNSVINEIALMLDKIDVLIYLISIYSFHTLQDHSAALYHHIMNVNMNSYFFLTQTVLSHMQKADYDQIINTATDMFLFSFTEISVYVISKAAVIDFICIITAEAESDVTANVLVSGLIWTETELKREQTQSLYNLMQNKQCIKHNELSQNIAHTVSFIASSETQFITDQSFDVEDEITFS